MIMHMSGRNILLHSISYLLGVLATIGYGEEVRADIPLTFIVFASESLAKGSNLAWLGEGIAYSVTEQIGIPGIHAVDYEKRAELTDDLDLPPNVALSRASMIRVAQEASADYLIMGSYSGTSENLSITLRLLDLKTMKLGGEITANGPLSVLPQMENELAWLILSNSGLNGIYTRGKFRERTRTIPNDSYAHFIRGLSSSDESDRLISLDRAIKLNPDFPEAHFWLGRNCFEKSDWPKAIQHLEHALKSARHFQEAEFMLGTCYLEQNSFEQSIQNYSHLLALKESLEVLNNLGVAYLRKGDYSLATQQFLDAQRMAKTNATVNLNFALLRHLQGNDLAARAILEDALLANPNNGMLHYLFSRVLDWQGERAPAKLASEKARRLGVNVEKMDKEDLRIWARIFLKWELR
jgi:tetratricopeptide (TPR) repeat protein